MQRFLDRSTCDPRSYVSSAVPRVPAVHFSQCTACSAHVVQARTKGLREPSHVFATTSEELLRMYAVVVDVVDIMWTHFCAHLRQKSITCRITSSACITLKWVMTTRYRLIFRWKLARRINLSLQAWRKETLTKEQ